MLDMLKDVPNRLTATLIIQNLTEAHFSLIETNDFRELPHLSLQFRKGTDEALKEYMSTQLTEYKNQNEILHSRSLRGEEDNGRLRQLCTEHENSLRNLREEFRNTTESLRSKHTNEFSCLKEEHAEQLMSIQKQNLEERTSMEKTLQSKIDELHTRTQRQENEIHTLTEEKFQLESSDSRNKETISAQVEKRTETETEMQRLRTENRNLNTANGQLEKQVTDLEWKLKMVSEKISEKENIASSHELTTQQSMKKITDLELEVGHLNQQMTKSMENSDYMAREIEKGNQYIQKLMQENQELQENVRQKRLKIKEVKQERVDMNKQHINEKLSNSHVIKDAEAKEKAAQQEMEIHKTKLLESQDTIKQQEKIISFLKENYGPSLISTAAPTPIQGLSTVTTPKNSLNPNITLASTPNTSTLEGDVSFNISGSVLTPPVDDADARQARVKALIAQMGQKKYLASQPALLQTPTGTSQGSGAGSGALDGNMPLTSSCTSLPRAPPKPYGENLAFASLRQNTTHTASLLRSPLSPDDEVVRYRPSPRIEPVT